MADSDKQILITPNISQTAQPEIKFVGKDNSPLYIKVLDDNSLSFEGTEGQVFSISPTMSSGDIFSVNDISGIQSIAVNADGTVALAPVSGNVGIGKDSSLTAKLHINTSGETDALRVDVDSSDDPDSSPFVIAEDGRVGIGTASPLSDMALTLNGDGTSYEGIAFQVGGSTKWKMSADSTSMYVDSQANGLDWRFRIRDSAGALRTLLTFDGGVGGGTDNAPGVIIGNDGNTNSSAGACMNKLQVNVGTLSGGVQDFNDGILIVNNDTAIADGDVIGGIGFDTRDGNVPSRTTEASAAIVAVAAEAQGTGDKGGHLTFLTSAIDDDHDTASGERMRLTSEGHLVVGATSCTATSSGHKTIEVAGSTQANFRATDTSGALYTDFAHSANDTYIMNRVAAGKIYIKPGNGDHSIELASDGQVKFNNAYTFPTSDGSANQVLMTDGSDTLSFTTLDISSHTNLAVSSPIILSGDTVGLDDPANLSELNESTDATDDKILLWDESAGSWKYMTLDNLQDSIDTTGGGGGSGISDIVEDTSPQLGGDLDTNSQNIIIDDAHGIYDENSNEQMLFQTVANATAYFQIWNGISDSTTGTLFGTDAVTHDTAGGGRLTGPGIEATGSATDVGFTMRTKGLGHFVMMNDDTTTASAPVLTLLRYHTSESDDDVLGLIKFMGPDSSMDNPGLEDHRDYAKIECNLVDSNTSSADGNLMFSALVANSHTDMMRVGVHEDDDNAVGVALFRGQMIDHGSNHTLTYADEAGCYVRATAAITLTLPASPSKGEQYVIISDHAGTTTISANGSDTMNGSTSNQTITTRYEAKTFIAVSASAWIVVG